MKKEYIFDKFSNNLLKMKKDFFEKIENRINLIFGNELDLQNYTKDNMIEVIITIYPK